VAALAAASDLPLAVAVPAWAGSAGVTSTIPAATYSESFVYLVLGN
jgi:hypothetical protein